MKTPKRHLFITCPICKWEYSAEEQYCPICEFGIPKKQKNETQRKTRARWKRRNREAQLKRTIARQKRVWKDYLDVIELYMGDEMNTMWWQDQEGS